MITMIGPTIIETLADLVAAGAHRTLETVGASMELDVPVATNYLSQRYGNLLRTPISEVAALTGRVQDAMHAARLVQLGQMPLDAEIPVMPGMRAGYNYTVYGYIDDPAGFAGRAGSISFPMNFNSPTPLSYDDIVSAAHELIEDARNAGQLRFGGALHGQVTLPGAFGEIVTQPDKIIPLPKITIASVYFGG
jgi:hypothetical protein